MMTEALADLSESIVEFKSHLESSLEAKFRTEPCQLWNCASGACEPNVRRWQRFLSVLDFLWVLRQASSTPVCQCPRRGRAPGGGLKISTGWGKSSQFGEGDDPRW